MGKSSPSPPPAPDPVKTAQAQTASNLATAQATSALNNVNQVTPWGNLTYQQNYVPKYDKNGNLLNGSGPEWTATTQLSPFEQHMLDLTNQGQDIYGNTALSQLQQAQGALSKPIDQNYDQYRQQAIDAAFSRLNPMFNQQEESMRARMLNSGITQGSDAWNNEYRNFNQGRNDAYLQAVANGGNTAGQALQQDIALRQEPLNETQALLTGQQVRAPAFVSTGSTPIAGTDIGGITNAAYQNQLASYNAQMANNSSMLGGLFGLGGSIIGGLLRSDARVKTDIRRVGTLDNGLPVYLFRYREGGPMQIGLMAQDVLSVRPDAVTTLTDGTYAVNYGRAAI